MQIYRAHKLNIERRLDSHAESAAAALAQAAKIAKQRKAAEAEFESWRSGKGALGVVASANAEALRKVLTSKTPEFDSTKSDSAPEKDESPEKGDPTKLKHEDGTKQPPSPSKNKSKLSQKRGLDMRENNERAALVASHWIFLRDYRRTLEARKLLAFGASVPQNRT